MGGFAYLAAVEDRCHDTSTQVTGQVGADSNVRVAPNHGGVSQTNDERCTGG